MATKRLADPKVKNAGRPFQVDTHPDREKIIRDIVNRRGSFGTIAKRYGLKPRHITGYVRSVFEKNAPKLASGTTLQTAEGIMAKLQESVDQLTMLSKAADQFLRDPDDPTKYTMDAQASDIDVVYTHDEEVDDGKGGTKIIKSRRRATLSELVRIHVPTGFQIMVKRDDPRRIFIELHRAIGEELDRFAKLIGAIKDTKVEISKTVVFNLFWSDVSKALQNVPGAIEALSTTFEEKAKDEDGNGS